MQVKELVDWIAHHFDLKMDDLCKNGVFVDCIEGAEITNVVTAVSPSIYAINTAIEKKANFMITHHALWRKSEEITITGVIKEKVKALLDNKITVISMHAPIDHHNKWSHGHIMMESLGFNHIQIRKVHGHHFIEGTFDGGAKLLYKQCKEFYGAEGKHAIVSDNSKKVWVMPGAGSKYFKDAIDHGADVYITGTSDEPNWYDAWENNVSFMSFGHYNTEKCGLQIIGEEISKQLGVQHSFIDEGNPL